MSINLVVAVTDYDWFRTLSQIPELSEANFWVPNPRNFRALQPGELFLFKLRAPYNKIVGGGIYAYSNRVPWTLAWEAFGDANGARSAEAMRRLIVQYRSSGPNDRSNFEIGCRILTQPFFFDEHDWIDPPSSWAPNIVAFKTYNTGEAEGHALWQSVQDRLSRQSGIVPGEIADRPARYGEPRLVSPRLGQGGFRVVVTDMYRRRCAVTQERTLPALDAAHIRPHHTGGENTISNGLLLRKDIHSLFDLGYVTVTPSLDFEVSQSIRDEFENGRDYYSLHGKRIQAPTQSNQSPNREALTWHNENVFRG